MRGCSWDFWGPELLEFARIFFQKLEEHIYLQNPKAPPPEGWRRVGMASLPITPAALPHIWSPHRLWNKWRILVAWFPSRPLKVTSPGRPSEGALVKDSRALSISKDELCSERPCGIHNCQLSACSQICQLLCSQEDFACCTYALVLQVASGETASRLI